MNHPLRLALIASLTLTTAACGKKKEEGGGGAASGGGGAPAAAAPIKLDKVGLSITVQGGGEASAMGDHNMLTGPEIGAMSVEVASAAKTADEIKKDAIESYSAEGYQQTLLEDGFAATWTNKGSAGANFFVEVYRTIGGKAIHCSTTVSKQSQADAVLAACKTLK